MMRRRHTPVAYPQAAGEAGAARVVLVRSGPTSTGRCLVHALLRSYGMAGGSREAMATPADTTGAALRRVCEEMNIAPSMPEVYGALAPVGVAQGNLLVAPDAPAPSCIPVAFCGGRSSPVEGMCRPPLLGSELRSAAGDGV
jgi:hypothetical protein